MLDFITGIDFTVLEFVRNHLTCAPLDVIMPFITLLGELGAIWILAAVAFLFSEKYRKSGITMLAAMLLGVLIGNALIKPLVARPRPFEVNNLILLLIEKPNDFSFPSGHTLSSFAAVTALFLTNRRLGLTALPLAMLIAFSRLYLCVHFLSDILGGMLLGIALGIAAYFLCGIFYRRYGKQMGEIRKKE